MLIFQCAKFSYNYKLSKTLNFKKFGGISAIGCADLDGNGTKEMMFAILPTDEDSSYIYIYEWQKDDFKYVWKSQPLGIVKDNTYIPEIIGRISATGQTNIIAYKELNPDLSSRILVAYGKYEVYYISYNLKTKNYGIIRQDEIRDMAPVDAYLSMPELKESKIVGYRMIDINGDKNLELVVAGIFKKSRLDDDETSYQGIKIFRYKKDLLKEVWQSGLISFISCIDVSDINNDKKLEILAGNYPGSIFIFSL